MSGSLWVFGYGSLLWDPGFDPAETVLARLPGWRRSFCMTSIHYRGTAESPGLVLSLDAAEGGVCQGAALAVRPEEADRVIEELRARELVSYAYREERLHVDLVDGRRVEAVTYVTDRSHPQYLGGLSLEEQAAIIARAAGSRGPNSDYLFNTAAHLHSLGLADPDLDWLAERVRALAG